MKDYNELNSNIKNWIEEIVQEDEYSLRAELLYKNIYNSIGDERQLASIYDVPVGLVKAIKEIDK